MDRLEPGDSRGIPMGLPQDPPSTRRQVADNLSTTRQIRKKLANSRRSHASASVLKNHRDPDARIYSIADLERIGWTIQAMYDSYQDFMLGKCPGPCGRYALDLDRAEISVDVIDPTLPAVWGINTQWMCVPDNQAKATKTHARRVADAIQRLEPILPPTPDPELTFHQKLAATDSSPKYCHGQASLFG
jgi:hypothetical protein